jgi:mRNA-degrading endonuclease YafQ of YafQ-DinJ toxin-antitoxin module
MNIYPTPKFLRLLKQKVKKKPSLESKIKQQLSLLLKSPRHPSLRLHKLKGKKVNQYSIWIESNLRITFLKEKNNYILTDLITHDQY